MELDPLESRLLLAMASLIDYQIAPPLAYANPTPLVVGDQVVFADAGNQSNNWQSAEVYDAATGQWSTQQFDHRLGDAAVAVGDQTIFAGGNSVTAGTACRLSAVRW
jgi:hypothetical protein